MTEKSTDGDNDVFNDNHDSEGGNFDDKNDQKTYKHYDISEKNIPILGTFTW